MSNPLRDSSARPHIAIFPSAGMGHLMPNLRLGALLLAHGCCITLITPRPTLTTAESAQIASFLSTYPEANHLELHLLPDDNGPDTASKIDPHHPRFVRIANSAHLIRPMLSSASPPFSALFFDKFVASETVSIATDLRIPFYMFYTSSIKFLHLLAFLPEFLSNPSKFINSCSEVEFPGLPPLPLESIPPPCFSPNHPFRRTLVATSGALRRAKAILVNTFEELEKQTLDALNRDRIIEDLPPLLPIGPLGPYRQHREPIPRGDYHKWLENQPVDSVLYVCFGSKAPVDAAQMQEIGKGLVKSGVRFLWAVKTKISLIDKDDNNGETRTEDVRELLGDSVWSKNGKDGLVISSWVDQDEVLASPAIGGFLSHCGWNSTSEATLAGVPILAWPQNGDQRMNAQFVMESGYGLWVKDWGMGSNNILKGEEIGKKIGEFMRDEKLRARARKIGEAARKAVSPGGSSHETITGVLRSLVSEN